MYGMVQERVTRQVRVKILKYVDLGWIDLEDIDDPSMYAIARWYLRIKRLQREISSLRASSRARRLCAFS